MLEICYYNAITMEELENHRYNDARRLTKREYKNIKLSALFNLRHADSVWFEVYNNDNIIRRPVITGGCCIIDDKIGFFHIEPTFTAETSNFFNRFHSTYFDPLYI